MNTVPVVLNVDDVEAQRYARSRILRQAGFEVVEAGTGAEALAQAFEHRPAAILLDVHLPDILGTEVCRQVKGDPRTAMTQVVHLSATHTDEAFQAMALATGADYYLVDPVSPEVLVGTMRAAVRHWEALRQLETARAELADAKEQYRVMGESVPYGVWRCNPHGGAEYASQSFLNLLEMTQEEMREFGWTHRLASEDVQPMLDRWLDCVRTGKPWDGEHRVLGPDGKYHYVLSRGLPVRDATGAITSWVGVNLDIDGRKEAERELSTSRERLDIAFRAGHIGTYDWNVQTGENAWSEEEEMLFGLEPGTFEGTLAGWAKRVVAEDAERVMHELNAAMQQRKREVDFSFRLIRPDGEIRWVEGAGRFFYDDSGRALRMVGFNVDVTARKSAEQALKRSEERLRQSNEDLQRFAYAASHDLQEPLRIIASFSQLLARRNEGKLDGDSQSYIHQITGSVERMQALIRSLLEYSQASHDEDLDMRASDANAALGLALQHLRFLIDESGAVVSFDKLPQVCASEPRVAQVFQNLISNSIKYAGDRQPRIHISASVEGNLCAFAVRDNGVGIDPAHQQQIFGVFKRLHARNVPGTGIGLAICKRIVERHGGRIWVESEPGQGSTFFFTLLVPQEARSASAE